jgi:hypothetical protein
MIQGQFRQFYETVLTSKVETVKGSVADPDPVLFDHWIQDPGWKKVRSGIRNKHSGSATLVKGHCFAI